MKAVTLQIDETHYEIFSLFAWHQGKCVKDFLLEAAKCAVTVSLRAADYGENFPDQFGFDKRLGGED